MNIFLPLYFEITKRKFYKVFRPSKIRKKTNHLISMPHNTRNFVLALPFLAALRKYGNIVLLMPETVKNIYGFLKRNIFETIFYKKPPLLFSKEYKLLKERLSKRHFHFLIELDVPANISLPYLASVENRICFYGNNNFPYYNILIRDNIRSLIEFFHIDEDNPQQLFNFYESRLKKISKKFIKKHPVLFVNAKNNVPWNGQKVIVGQDILPSDKNAYQILYLADAYYGKHDAFYEFAKIFNKEIIKP